MELGGKYLKWLNVNSFCKLFNVCFVFYANSSDDLPYTAITIMFFVNSYDVYIFPKRLLYICVLSDSVNYFSWRGIYFVVSDITYLVLKSLNVLPYMHMTVLLQVSQRDLDWNDFLVQFNLQYFCCALSINHVLFVI